LGLAELAARKALKALPAVQFMPARRRFAQGSNVLLRRAGTCSIQLLRNGGED